MQTLAINTKPSNESASMVQPKQTQRLTNISQSLIDAVIVRARDNRRIRRTLPKEGRIHIDRQVPFLCVYRRTPASAHLDMQYLVTSEAAYVYADSGNDLYPSLRQMVTEVAHTMVEQFGSCLILEIWPGDFDKECAEDDSPHLLSAPRFRIVKPREYERNQFIDKLVESLSRIKTDERRANVELVSRTRIAPPVTSCRRTSSPSLRRHPSVMPSDSSSRKASEAARWSTTATSSSG